MWTVFPSDHIVKQTEPHTYDYLALHTLLCLFDIDIDVRQLESQTKKVRRLTVDG